MADQYMNFSNPTIVPDQKYGFQGMNQAMQGAGKSFGDMLMQQYQQKQALQLSMAQEAAKAQFDVWAKLQDPLAREMQIGRLGSMGFPVQGMNPTANVPPMSSLLAGNPYANMVPQWTPQSQPSQYSPMMPSQQPGNYQPTAGGPQNSNLTFSNPGQASNFSSFNPVSPQGGSNGMVQESVKMGPFGPQPGEYTNIPGKQQVSEALNYSSDIGKAKAEADKGMSRDVQQLGMIKNAMKPIVDSYNEVYGGKIGGMYPAGGDKYGSFAVKNASFIPRGIQDAVVSPDIQNAGGKFLANKNELITKMQPLLSQQFGAQGSSRIMESLLNMSQAEIGDLSTPKAQFEGQVEGTLRSMYRIAKAAEAYKTDLAASGQPAPAPDVAAQQIAQRMQMQNMSPEEEKTVSGMVNEVLGRKANFTMTGNQFDQGQGTSQGNQPVPPQANAMLQQYKQKYPGRTDQEILGAMKKQGLI